uniref:Uncharacterized protein n=1 Tax=Tetranychus urticae TaxID=32264 RepID=T1JQI3_TETUR
MYCPLWCIHRGLLIDLMIRKLFIKQDVIENLMKFLRRKTGLGRKATRRTYYFINFSGFVNVVKY